MAVKYFVGDKLISEKAVPSYTGRQITAYGLSTDTKPEHMGDCDVFYEKDTAKLYIYDSDSNTWMEQ